MTDSVDDKLLARSAEGQEFILRELAVFNDRVRQRCPGVLFALAVGYDAEGVLDAHPYESGEELGILTDALQAALGKDGREWAIHFKVETLGKTATPEQIAKAETMRAILDTLAEPDEVEQTDEEILAEAREDGVDVSAEAERVRGVLLDAVRRHRIGRDDDPTPAQLTAAIDQLYLIADCVLEDGDADRADDLQHVAAYLDAVSLGRTITEAVLPTRDQLIAAVEQLSRWGDSALDGTLDGTLDDGDADHARNLQCVAAYLAATTQFGIDGDDVEDEGKAYGPPKI